MTSLSRKTKRGIAAALKESTKSPYGRISIGAVICSGSRIISRGHNSTRTHPAQASANAVTKRVCTGAATHAEVAAVINSRKQNLTGCVMYVGRFDRNGMLANCRPCLACQYILRLAGIRHCYYTDSAGIKELVFE